MKSDDQLLQKVVGELVGDPNLSADRIAVVVESGIATLTGAVRTLAEREAARCAVQRVGDVKGVVVALDILAPACWERTDAEIARVANAMLAWSLSVLNRIEIDT